MKLLKKRWKILTKIVIFIAILAGVVIYFIERAPKQNIPHNSCPSTTTFVSMFQANIFDNKLSIEPFDPKTGGVFTWKLKEGMPQIGYDSISGLDGTYNGTQTEIENVINIYNKKIDPEMINLGFTKDVLNTYEKKTSPQTKLINYGYKNGDVLIQVFISQGNTFDPQSGVRIFARCGVKSSEDNKLFEDLLSSQKAVISLKSVNQTMNLEDILLWISDVYDKNLIGIGTARVEVFFHRENGQWVDVEESQMGPRCSLLKKYNINGNYYCF